ncbi:MAG: Gfo/Idh/MocA family protein [Vicinamibacterales bacterium]
MSVAPLRLALVGCGEVTKAKHLPSLAEISDIAVVALADSEIARARSLASRYSVSWTGSDIGGLLSGSEAPAVDAIGICTPPGAHRDLALAALGAGKHVWVDKPLTLTIEDAIDLVTAAGEGHLVAATGFHMRSHRLVCRAREIVRAGALGTIESIRIAWHSPRGDEHIPEWKTRRDLGGGALTEIAVHHLDLLRFLLDTEIDEIFALSVDRRRHDECAVISARLRNGVLASGEFSERAPHEIEIVISGSDGWLRVDCLRFDGLEFRTARQVPGAPDVRWRQALAGLRDLPQGLSAMRKGGDYRDSYRRAWKDFADAVRTARRPAATFADGLCGVEAVTAAVQSSLSGMPVAVAGRTPSARRRDR